jgi:hypothetical protein
MSLSSIAQSIQSVAPDKSSLSVAQAAQFEVFKKSVDIQASAVLDLINSVQAHEPSSYRVRSMPPPSVANSTRRHSQDVQSIPRDTKEAIWLKHL